MRFSLYYNRIEAGRMGVLVHFGTGWDAVADRRHVLGQFFEFAQIPRLEAVIYAHFLKLSLFLWAGSLSL
jgi:hypothetical protein